MIIAAIHVDQATVRTAYSRRSGLYDRTVANLEWPAHVAALDALAATPGETIIDVAVGPGRSTAALAQRVGPTGHVAAVDLSPGMLALARRRIEARDASHVTFHEAAADRLPFADGTADALYNAYMLDLIRLDAMPAIRGSSIAC
jgi:ubiquinone/menaquinone biosynthesis C-methylase UbiE